jgi:cbb3-type cytochrome oxidase subunit 3
MRASSSVSAELSPPTVIRPSAMAVIPLTLTISLCLVFTFVLFFLREHARHRFSSAESEALLPLADEQRRTASAEPIVLELRGREPRPGAGGCGGRHRREGAHETCDDCRRHG